jgi:hypothetical protein
MDKVLTSIQVVETDDGVRIEINGEKAKEMFGSCCHGGRAFAMPIAFACCTSSEEDAEKGENKKEC